MNNKTDKTPSKAMKDIDQRRYSLGISREFFCKKAGITMNTYSNWMYGRGQGTIKALEDALEELENE